MTLSHRVRVHVASPGGPRESVLETAQGSLRSRLLTRLLGNQYAVVVLTPRGKNVTAVEIVESAKSTPA